MCRGLIGKKLGMSGIFSPDGTYVPVTVLQVGPCAVTQVKTKETDGYGAVQLGYQDKKDKHTNKPSKGHFERSGGKNYRFLKEFKVDKPEEFEAGQTISLDIFNVGEFVSVTGTSKGRGFAGVMKRHGFAGGRATHGSRSHRIPGSIGCSAWPAKVFKGKKLPGHYGVDKVSVKNLEIIDIRPEDNVILVKGAVPGSKEGLIQINKI